MASIEKRANGSYRIVASSGYDSKGKKIRHYETVAADELAGLTERQKQKELERRKVLFDQKVKNGTFLDGEKLTLKEYIEKWLQDYAEKQLSPKTVYEYKRLLENRVLPALGHIRLSKLQPAHIIEFYNNLGESGIRMDCKFKIKKDYFDLFKAKRKYMKDISMSTLTSIAKGNSTTKEIAQKISAYCNAPLNKMFSRDEKKTKLSNNAISHYHRVISTALTTAVQWQLIFDNPCSRVKPPKVERKEAKHYDESQVANMFLLLNEEDIRCKLAVYIGVFAGIRLGEMSALEWSDIDFKNNTMKISKNRQYVPKMGTFDKTTKTFSGNRIISIPPILINILSEYKEHQLGEKQKYQELWEDTGKIFTQWNGKEIFPTTPSKWFSEFIKKTQLERITFHQLRHTNASILIAQGVDVVTVSKRLGHAKTSTTTDIYSHQIKKADNEAANKLENLFKTDEKH